jgi:hypothetical protein
MPGSSRGSQHNYQGAHVGKVYARLVQGVPARSPHGGGVRQDRPGGPGTITREHTWGRLRQACAGGPGTTTRADTWGSCTPRSSSGSRYTCQGANVGEVYTWRVQRSLNNIHINQCATFVLYAQAFEKLMEFSSSTRLGWLTFCPTNLGTTIRYRLAYLLPNQF